ncbi:unnamed protein product [Parnassius apollo]|uniref:(apollo) hypothetical protein n=1 Tax=Parnassius apollo TaxID=110799 RepID=A0A8S3X6E8_PARAO|nr:unnamed protein product [Parnassius apollo]
MNVVKDVKSNIQKIIETKMRLTMLEPSQPQVSYTADTAERIPSPPEIEILALTSAAEDTPITMPADVTSPPAHPVSLVPGPSNSRNIQGEGRRYLLALLHLIVAVSNSGDCDEHHLTEPSASLWQYRRIGCVSKGRGMHVNTSLKLNDLK